MMRRFATVAITLALTLGYATCNIAPTFAAAGGGDGAKDPTEAGCSGGEGGLQCGVVVTTPGGVASGGSGTVARPFFWQYEVLVFGSGGAVSIDVAAAAFQQAGGIAAPGGGTPAGLTPGAVACGTRQAGALVDGQVALGQEIQRSTGQVVATRYACLALRNAAAQPANAAPTYADIWRAVLIPKPTVNVSPKVTGLTGLPTWFWYDQANEVRVDATLNGWTVTGTARLTRVVWDAGDHHTASADGTFDAPVPQSTEHDHAAEYVYETKGSYQLGVVTEWTGRVHITGPAGENADEPIGTFRLAPVARVYDVLEARASLIPSPPSG